MLLIFAAPLVALCVYRARRLGGGLSQIARSDVAWLALPIGSFLLEAAFQAASRFVSVPTTLRIAQVLASYAALFGFAVRNARWDWGALAAGAGAGLNFLVIALNGFVMPVSQGALAVAGRERAIEMLTGGEIYGYGLLTSWTRLPLLADVIPLLGGRGGYASLGDIVLVAAVARVLYAMMLPKGKGRMEA